MFYFRTNDAGSGVRYFRTNDAPATGVVQGVNDAESVPQAAAVGYRIVTFAAPFNFGVGSFFAPFRFTGVPADGNTARYPNLGGLLIASDGTLSAGSNNLTVDYYWNDGSGEVLRTLIIDDSTHVLVNGVNDAETVPSVSAIGSGPPANATVQGVNDIETVPGVSGSAVVTGTVQGVTDVETVPQVVSGLPQAGNATVKGVFDNEVVPEVTAVSIRKPIYASLAAMTARFGATEILQLTDKENTGSVDTVVLDQAFADAEAEIDGYLEGRYRLPLASVPRVLVTYACDITRYRLYDDRATDQVTKRYEAAIKFLAMVAKRQIGLGIREDDAPPVATTGGPSSSGPTQVFSDDNLSGFRGDM